MPQVVVSASQPIAQALALNAACRSAGVSFVLAEAAGALGTVFCDFGSTFPVSDTTGEEPVVRLIESVEPVDRGAVVTVHSEEPHGLSEGDVVTFTELRGAAVSQCSRSMPRSRVARRPGAALSAKPPPPRSP